MGGMCWPDSLPFKVERRPYGDEQRNRSGLQQASPLEAEPHHVDKEGPAFLPVYLHRLWLVTFPDAKVTKLDDAGHYLQEDAHEQIVPELVRFVGGLGQA
jgi:hypothetical protein